MKRFALALCAALLATLPLTAASEGERLHAIFDAEWEYSLEDFPFMATFVGDPRYADQVPDLSRAAIERREAHARELLVRLDSIDLDALSADDQLNYRLYRQQAEDDVEGQRFPGYLMPINQMGGIHSWVPQLSRMTPRFTIQNVEDLLTRLSKVPTLVDQVIEIMRDGLAKGVTPPKVTLAGVEAQIAAQIVDDPSTSPVYGAAFAELPSAIPAEEHARLQEKAKTVISVSLVPAFRRLHSFWVDEYYPGTRTEIGMSSLPDGKAWYEHNVRTQTTTDLSADAIHETGLSEVARIRGEMERVKSEAGFEGGLEEFFDFLRTDPQFFFTEKEDLLAAYRDIAKRIDPELPKLFGHLPRLTYGVTPVPAYAEKTQTTAYYNPGSLEAGRPGYFYANTYDLPSRPKWEMEALTIHEAVPGHHFQISIAQELENVPRFRQHGGFTAFVEGWGLYSESLGPDLGMYEDPYSKFGQLTYEMWRAVRLVVDTGLHSKGWSRQQAIDFFKANAGKAEHDITVEVDRYIVWPGQALAYKIGELKIQELRRFAEEELGESFDVRSFHDHLLGAGALPLDILEQRMKDWVESHRG